MTFKFDKKLLSVYMSLHVSAGTHRGQKMAAEPVDLNTGKY